MRGRDNTPMRMLRVFTDEDGHWGNPLGVIDGESIRARPPASGTELGFSETVFIDDYQRGRLRIFTPSSRDPLAGHPLVGAAWLLSRQRQQDPVFELRPPGGLVRAWRDEAGKAWVDSPLATLPDWTLVEMSSPGAVEQLTGPVNPDHDHVVYWAWIDTGLIRARCFAPRYGVAEDEATGSAALRLTSLLGQPLWIRQGKGSLLLARPLDAERAVVGGTVVEDVALRLP